METSVTKPRPHAWRSGRRSLGLSIVLGIITSLVYFAWWFQANRLREPWLAAAFAVAAIYFFIQVYCAWYVYLRMRAPAGRSAPPGFEVDVFVPAYDEPYELVEGCLRAAVAMRYPHRTFLLDDSDEPRLSSLASELDVAYFTRRNRAEAKAGNVNAALEASHAEFVTVFDVDHVPEPDFLDHVLGYFVDPTVGFVQSGIGFRNAQDSWVARSAAEQATDAYGPASMGMHGCDAAQVWGSHCTFRRAALDSIRGHQTGLAEDLHTSLKLHSAGWRSVFVPSLKARGLVPYDLVAMVKQQFKWARGVFEILLRVYPRLSRRLSLRQNLAYLLRCTYYLIGPVFLVHSLVAAWVLLLGRTEARAAFASYVFYCLPFALSILLVRRAAYSVWRGRTVPLTVNWRGYMHTFLLWPVYTLALIYSILGIASSHVATPKTFSDRSTAALVVPQLLLSGLLMSVVVYRSVEGFVVTDLLPILFALSAAAIQSLAILAASFPSRQPPTMGHYWEPEVAAKSADRGAPPRRVDDANAVL